MKRHPWSHGLVVCQFAGVLLACYPVGWSNRGPAWTLLFCLVGAGLGLWALGFNKLGNFSVYPEVKTAARLITDGPYRYIRHPMYGALTVMLLGVALYNGHPVNYLGLALAAFAMGAKAFVEERFLRQRFADYAAYQARTWRFIPYLY